MNFVRWLLSCAAGVGAWYVAAAGNTMTFWPRLGMWVLFWMLLSVYVAVEKNRE